MSSLSIPCISLTTQTCLGVKNATEQVQPHPGAEKVSSKETEASPRQWSSVSLSISLLLPHKRTTWSTAQTATCGSALAETHTPVFLHLVCTTARQADYTLLFMCLVGRAREGGVTCLAGTVRSVGSRGRTDFSGFSTHGEGDCEAKVQERAGPFCLRRERAESHSKSLTHESRRRKPQRQPQLH